MKLTPRQRAVRYARRHSGRTATIDAWIAGYKAGQRDCYREVATLIVRNTKAYQLNDSNSGDWPVRRMADGSPVPPPTKATHSG